MHVTTGLIVRLICMFKALQIRYGSLVHDATKPIFSCDGLARISGDSQPGS